MINDKPLFESKKMGAKIFGILLIILFQACLGAFFIYLAFTDPLGSLTMNLAAGLAFLLSALLVLVMYLKGVDYKIYADRIEIYRKSGQLKETLLFYDIDSWDEIEIPLKSGKTPTLYIFAHNKPIAVAGPNGYDNYAALKKHISSLKKRNNTDWQANKFAGGTPWLKLVTVFALVLLAGGTIGILYKQQPVLQQQLVGVSGPLAGAKYISAGKKGSRFTLTLQNYPQFTFVMKPGSGAFARGNEFLRTIQAGDTVELYVPADAYNIKLTKQKPPDLWNRFYLYKYIDAYSLSKGSTQFASLALWNQANAGKTNKDCLPLLIWGFMILFGCISFYRNMNKRRQQTSD